MEMRFRGETSKLVEHAAFRDGVCRRALNTLFRDTNMDKTFNSKDSLEAYVKDLMRGVIPPPKSAV